MARPRNQRQPKSAIYWDSKAETWRTIVNVGTKPNGQPDRRHRQDKDRDKLVEKVLKLEDMAAERAVPPPGTRYRVGDWMDYWLEHRAAGGYNTLQIREWAIRLYIRPRLGRWWMDEITTEQIDGMYRDLDDEGLAPKSIGLIHETLLLALKLAHTYGYVRSNPALAATLPEAVVMEFDPPTAAETMAILAEAGKRRNFVRWLLGFLGPRQGEVLGARWSDLDDDAFWNVRGQAQRRKYEHGCGDPIACAARHCVTKPCEGPWQHGCAEPQGCAKRHCNRPTYPSDIKRGIRTKPCPPSCTGHARGCPERYRGPCSRKRHKTCPELCPPNCTGHAKACPQRIGGIILDEPVKIDPETREPEKKRARGRRVSARAKRVATKTTAGERRLGIPTAFQPYLAAHRKQQAIERELAGSKWEEHGLIVCTEFGRPIDRSRDWQEWSDILEAAGVDHLPAHAARHAAASFLLALGVDRRIVMDIMGWKDERMLTRYQHVADELRREAAEQVGGLLSLAAPGL